MSAERRDLVALCSFLTPSRFPFRPSSFDQSTHSLFTGARASFHSRSYRERLEHFLLVAENLYFICSDLARIELKHRPRQ